jgi:hypothetical protein
MDYFGYPSLTNEPLARAAPKLRLGALYQPLDFSRGGFINLVQTEDIKWQIKPFTKMGDKTYSPGFIQKPTSAWHGHHVAIDDNFSSLLDIDPQVPVAPLFGKDLAGRVIYLSYGPIKKTLADWSAYGADVRVKNEAGAETLPNMGLQGINFPHGCRSVKGAMDGEELLENVFLTKFRTLDVAFYPRARASGSTARQLGVYENANLYPYKCRLDTFYTDGYKLPQINALFAEWDGINPTKAKALGQTVLDTFNTRKHGQDYESWVVAQGGEEWVDTLFKQGCTLIPTFEACNGWHVVGKNFELEDYWPGSAVAGLHVVESTRDDKAPFGTILEVLAPGYVTATTVVPARVIISNGSGYVSPHEDNPLPVIPNLNLPHPRTAAEWGTTWLPTHPLHFEPPALWGWDMLTGHFVQQSGPLWDPVHYYYASVPEVLKAYERPLSFEDNRWLVPVPKPMKNRFYPAVQLMGFDTLSADARSRRAEHKILPLSATAHVADGTLSAGIGYHPLPLEFEYELEPFWAPELHPLNRLHGLCPPDLSLRICAVITPSVGINRYTQSVVEPEGGAPWLKNEELLQTPTENPFENYPQLARYIAPDLPPEEVLAIMQPPFVADPGAALLTQTVAELWDGLDAYDDIEALQAGLYDKLMDARADGIKLMRLRHTVYRENLLLYGLATWFGLDALEMIDIYVAWAEGKAPEGLTGFASLIAPLVLQASPPPVNTEIATTRSQIAALAPDGTLLPALQTGSAGIPEV